MKKVMIGIFCLVLPLFSLTSVKAYTVPKIVDKVIIDTNISVNDEVDSDLYFAGNSVNINADVLGDVIGAGYTVNVTGNVSDNIRLAGNILNFTDLTANNMSVVGSNIKFYDIMANRVYAAGETVDFSGSASNINFAGSKVTISGTISGVSNIYADQVIIEESAVIDGKLYINAEKAIKYDGDVDKDNIIYKHINNYERAKTFNYVNRVYSFIYGFITVMILALIIMVIGKKFTDRAIDNLKSRPVSTILLGLLFVIAIPILIVLGMITVIGVPLAVISLFGYIVLFIIARAFTSLALSHLLFEKLELNKYVKLLLAVLITSVLTIIPVINFFAYLLYFGYTFGSAKLLFTKEK